MEAIPIKGRFERVVHKKIWHHPKYKRHIKKRVLEITLRTKRAVSSIEPILLLDQDRRVSYIDIRII
jgi:hypothetical protein